MLRQNVYSSVLRFVNLLEMVNLISSVWRGESWLGNIQVSGESREGNYKALVENFMKTYKNMECNMSLKMHFLASHFELFPVKGGAVSDGYGERFHQGISSLEKGQQGRWNTTMLVHYYWTLARDVLLTT